MPKKTSRPILTLDPGLQDLGYAVFSDHIPTPALLRERTARLFDWIAEGKLKIEIGGTYPLAEAARAHIDMESRRSAGKLLLIP